MTEGGGFQYLTLDLWQAVGCPVREFAGYLERNGLDGTWAVLLSAVRNPGRCLKPVDGNADDLCVLSPHAPEHPCWGARDVGREEPLPLPVDKWAADFRAALKGG